MKFKFYFILLVVLFILSCTQNTTNPQTPENPSDLLLMQLDTELIFLTWQDHSNNEDGFRLDRKIGENDWVENYQLLIENTTSFIDSALISMPLQFGNISLVATPSHVDWLWHVPKNPNPPPLGSDSLSTTVRVQVQDGQGNLINNQAIHFTSSHGMPYPCTPGGNPYSGLTGFVNGQNGSLHKLIYFQYYECVPPIPVPPGTTYVTVEAYILGTNIFGQTGVTLNRYID